ncbi:MAG: hypothetical protein ACYC7B_15580 [Burkholderiales bacterium]
MMNRELPCWTTKKPTQPGWYWHRRTSDNDHTAIAAVGRDGSALFLLWLGCDVRFSLDDFAPTHQWAGPILPPE